MMNLAQFVAENNGQGLDFDGYYGDQCVDLVQFWAKNLGTHTFYGDAKDIIDQAGSDYIRINNTPDNFPSEGDIVVWRANGKVTGPAGHVDIAYGNCTRDSYDGFDQNWLGHQYSEIIKNHPYSDVVGWLHPKILDNQEVNMPTIVDKDLQQKILNLTLAKENQPSDPSYGLGGSVEDVLSDIDRNPKKLQILYPQAQDDLATCQATQGNSTKWETLKALLRELLG